MKNLLFLLITAFVCHSCGFTGKKEDTKTSGTRIVKEYHENGLIKSEVSVKGNIREGITKKYDQRGRLISEINYVNNKKEGLYKEFYPSGDVYSSITFKNGIKEGEEIWFYENGKPYRVNPFHMGKINGIQKWYYKTGKLKGEVPYKNGLPGIGLKEYKEDGTLVTSYPEIVFKEIDQVVMLDKFTLQISLSNNSRKVKFYLDELDEGKYTKKFMVEIPTEKGIASQTYDVPKGFLKIEKINIIAHYTTPSGLPYIMQKKYNLALQH